MRYKKIDNLIVLENGKIYIETKNKCKLTGLTKTKTGYLRVSVKGKDMYVHRLVMLAFYGKSDLTVDHIDGNKENNNLNNLEYVTQAENVKRFHDKKVLWNNREFRSFSDLARYVGVAHQSVSENYSKGYKLKGHIIEVIK
ncbi:HNH endonuclease [Lactococcus phage LP9210]|uniref:HNH endonuclease n=3 Tax=Skunavirus LP8511 TaxID=2845414 RepID=A0A2K8IBN3_9CAUD|nr:HNH endonuclease [Lactococcus phage LP8511]ATE82775.1 HNH endonuclease [Lactococcus phage LP9104]ATE82984.1 HNH endonuclease [Lactococcus phage LP9206b]ATE83143.1 HNH endonuclease [Lactococcus phage LP9210]QPL22494.1 HNH endonuclease [Lactococcus phage GL7]ATE82723.1 HNH endonuclease [Lactococcus phage LP8511]